MRVAVLFSGGKDSTLALYEARRYHDIACLISLVSINPESYMFHVPNIHLAPYQAKAMELPLIQKKTTGIKEKELDDLKQAIKEAIDLYDIQGLVTGAVRSIYQAQRIQKICHKLDIWCFNPLWLRNQVKLLQQVLENNLDVIISGIFSYPFDSTFLGRKLDQELVMILSRFQREFGINPAGEGGEIETTVLDAPFFKKKIIVRKADVVYSNYSGVFQIKEVELVDK